MQISIRKDDVKDAEDIAKVHVDTWRTTYQGILPEEYLSNLSYDQCRRNWEKIHLAPKSQEAVFVAEDDFDNIVGFADCGEDRDKDPIYKGEIYAIYILEKMQWLGIGRQFMLAAAKDLKNRGFNSLIVWVLAENPSRRFYEKLGGEHVQTRAIMVGGEQFTECGYGWKNLDSLITSH